MGLLGAPASFQRLMEKVVEDIHITQVYICHSADHPEHLDLLDQVLARLTRHCIMMNLSKCVFGSPQVTSLGFELTPEGIKPRRNKLACVTKILRPTNTWEVRQCPEFRPECRQAQ